jgi:hypothetical protein
LLHTARLLCVEGHLQSVDGVVHVLGRTFQEIELAGTAPPSHDFH